MSYNWLKGIFAHAHSKYMWVQIVALALLTTFSLCVWDVLKGNSKNSFVKLGFYFNKIEVWLDVQIFISSKQFN